MVESRKSCIWLRCSKRGPGENWRELPLGGPSSGIGGNQKVLFLVNVQQKGARKKLARATAWGAVPLGIGGKQKILFLVKVQQKGARKKLARATAWGALPLELVKARKSCEPLFRHSRFPARLNSSKETTPEILATQMRRSPCNFQAKSKQNNLGRTTAWCCKSYDCLTQLLRRQENYRLGGPPQVLQIL